MAIAKRFLIFKETKIIAVIERNEAMRRGVEGRRVAAESDDYYSGLRD